MSALIIEIPHASITAQTPLRYVLSADGQASERSGSAAAALLPQPGRAGTVTLVLAPQALSWHRVQWPKVSLRDRQRARAVLHGLLEDHVLDDVQHLHMALAPDTAAGQPAWVAVCGRDWLQNALSVLAQAGVQAHRIVPAFAPESAATPGLTALGSDGDAWLVVRHADADGRVLTLPLTAAAAQLDIIAHSPPDAPVEAEPAVYQQAQRLLGRPAELLELPRYLLQAAQTRWNLAQFQFANAGKDRLAQSLGGGLQALLRGPQWRLARWGAGLLLMAQLAGLNAWAWQARQQLQDKRNAVETIFRATFPTVPVVVDAPLQMQREVARLQQQSGALGPAAFEVLAAASGAALQQLRLPDTPRAVRYEGQTLRLEGLNLSDEHLRQLQAILEADRLHVSQQEAGLLITAAAGAQP